VRFDEPDGEQFHRRRRALYATAASVLAMIVGFAVVEEISGLPLYGVDHRAVQISSGGIELRVEYPRTTRGQLDSALKATIHRPGGFDGPLAIEIATSFLDEFTIRRVLPEPASEVRRADMIELTFEKPRSDVFVVRWDLAAQPSGWFSRVDGRVSVILAGSDQAASVSFRTDVRP
jgi:hypothetical protein